MIPPELAQLNKRVVHRQMEVMGIRTGIRVGTELCALGTHTQAMADFVAASAGGNLTGALGARREVRRLPHLGALTFLRFCIWIGRQGDRSR